MSERSYWLDLFTGETWKQFLEAGGTVSGFRESRWATVQQLQPSDYLLCYLTGVSRFVGVLEVTSQPFRDTRPIWKDEVFPCRVEVKVVVALRPDTAVPIHDMSDRLSIFRDLKSPVAWTGHVRGSPARWKETDGEVIVTSLLEAERNPVSRPVDAVKLKRRPTALSTPRGPVTVPDPDASEKEPIVGAEGLAGPAKEPSIHTEIQRMLLKLGSDMGLHVWVARNDRNTQVNGQTLGDIPRMRAQLPVQFDQATQQIIELIDVLWLDGSTIVAAFEIEHTTSIYSGLLRMSDLIAMQPNLKIPLYLVAPEERRNKVIREVNRPTFARLSPPMAETCQFISFEELQRRMREVQPYVQYLKPQFVEELAEPCHVEEA